MNSFLNFLVVFYKHNLRFVFVIKRFLLYLKMDIFLVLNQYVAMIYKNVKKFETVKKLKKIKKEKKKMKNFELTFYFFNTLFSREKGMKRGIEIMGEVFDDCLKDVWKIEF